jgi:hypothetical protein
MVLDHEGSGTTRAVQVRDPLHSPVYRLVQLLGAGVALLWSLRLRWQKVSEANVVNLTLAAGLAWLLLFGPATEHATYVLLAPALCWALVQRDVSPHLWRRRLIELAAVLILIFGWGAIGITVAGETWGLVPLPIGCVLFVIALVGFERVQGPESQKPEIPVSDTSNNSSVIAAAA